MDTGMTQQEAEVLATAIRDATGLSVTVQPDGEWFAVEVTKSVGDALNDGVWTLYDEADWQWLAERIVIQAD